MNDEEVNKIAELLKEHIKPTAQCSFSARYGGTGSDVKIYFTDANDLLDQLTNLVVMREAIKDKLVKLQEIGQ